MLTTYSSHPLENGNNFMAFWIYYKAVENGHYRMILHLDIKAFEHLSVETHKPCSKMDEFQLSNNKFI